MANTDSAANQFGAPESVNETRGTFPLFATGFCPSRRMSDLETGETS